MIRNTPLQWGWLSKSFHWVIMMLILVEVPVGFLMSYTYGLALRDQQRALPLHNLASQIHHTVGFSVLLLALSRLSWRFSGTRPAPTSRFGLRGIAAGTVHTALYALLIVVPLSGWAALSVYGEAPIWLFDRSGLVPAILPKVPLHDAHGYGYYAKMHVLFLEVGLVVIATHAAAALWHHFYLRDDVLLRMWPLAKLKMPNPPQ